jgi:hypothetical protein
MRFMREPALRASIHTPQKKVVVTEKLRQGLCNNKA